MLWAMATLQLQPPPAPPAAGRSAAAGKARGAAAPQAPASDAQAATAAAAAAAELAAAGAGASPWWRQFQAAVVGQLWHFNGVGVANLVWAAAKLGLQPSPQLGELLLWQGQRTFWQMDLQLLVSLAWGVAQLGLTPRRFWLHRLCNRVSNKPWGQWQLPRPATQSRSHAFADAALSPPGSQLLQHLLTLMRLSRCCPLGLIQPNPSPPSGC